MEITAQIAALEDEVKVLKGEVKSILEEIRVFLLDRDNPFAPGAGMPVFQPVERPGAGEEPGPEASTGPIAAPEPDAEAVTPPGPVPAPPTDSGPQVGPAPAAAAPQPIAANPGAGIGPAPAPEPPLEYAGPERWSVSTIASLVAWIDEATSRLGQTHLQVILDLTRFSGLLPPEAEEVLLKVIKLASGRKDSAAPSVNDILLALRQLEAILEGDEADELSLVRRRRTAGRNR